MTVFENAVFISCEDDCTIFTVMAVDKGRIVYTGDELPPLSGKSRRVDLGGAAVVPVFGDTHLHFESYALFLSTVDVRKAGNFNEMGHLLRSYIQKHPKTKLLPAFGCTAHCVAEGRLPERADVDAMIETPLLLVKYDGHAAVANSALISLFPANVISDPGFDTATGWLYQNAFYKGVNFVTESMPPMGMLSGMEYASRVLAEAGVGYLHTCEGVGYKNDIDVDTLRVVRYALPQCFRIFFQTADTQKIVRRGLTRVGGCFSLALDGCFGSKDAALGGGYADEPDNKGFLPYTQQEINDFCIRANRLNLQIALHAIGDAAVEQALNAFDAALCNYPREDHRHIIIHADLIPRPMIERAAKMNIAIALQPNFLRWREEPPEYLERILGTQARELLPLRDFIDAGILISAGSDAPCTVPHPIESIYNCCNHPTPSQSVTIEEALKMHTLWPAKMCFDETDRGSLTMGKIADFTVLSGNPLEMPVDELKNITVKDIYFNGKRFDSSRRKTMLGIIAESAAGKLFRKEKN
ncbi:MAG: amidohydrolase family protein [Treponema sp.]|nr:amidohydrolase family protein [Treponema sp.]